jgi:hypothetical protein
MYGRPTDRDHLDGRKIKAYDGEWLVDAITREKGLPTDHPCIRDRGGDARCASEKNKTVCTYCGVGRSFDNGRILEHFHEGNMTYRVPGIQQETPERWVEISPELTQERGLHSGHWVELKFAPRRSAFQGAGHGASRGEASVSAIELAGGGGQHPHQQQHGPGHAHPGL